MIIFYIHCISDVYIVQFQTEMNKFIKYLRVEFFLLGISFTKIFWNQCLRKKERHLSLLAYYDGNCLGITRGCFALFKVQTIVWEENWSKNWKIY